MTLPTAPPARGATLGFKAVPAINIFTNKVTTGSSLVCLTEVAPNTFPLLCHFRKENWIGEKDTPGSGKKHLLESPDQQKCIVLNVEKREA